MAILGGTKAMVDSTGVGDPIVEDLHRVCRRVEGFKFSSQSKQQIMEGLAASIQRTELTFPDGILRNELDSFCYEYHRGGVSYEAPSGLHDDGVCALALANHAFGGRKTVMGFGVPSMSLCNGRETNRILEIIEAKRDRSCIGA
jgi:hypothetical protein